MTHSAWFSAAPPAYPPEYSLTITGGAVVDAYLCRPYSVYPVPPALRRSRALNRGYGACVYLTALSAPFAYTCGLSGMLAEVTLRVRDGRLRDVHAEMR